MEHSDKQRQRFFFRAGIRFCALFIVLALSQVAFGQCTLTAVNAGNDVTICNGSTTQLNAVKTGGTSVTYLWTPSTGLSNPTISNPIASPAATTTYTVTANEGTCTATNQVVVTVNQLPVIDFSFINNQCSSTPVQFTSSVKGMGIYSYAWTFGDGSTSTEQNPNHSFTAIPGNGTQHFNVFVTVTNTATNCSNSVAKAVSIKQAPDALLNSDATLDNSLGQPTFKTCSNTSTAITFTNASTTSAWNVNYVIDWGDGSPIFSVSSWSTPMTHIYSIGYWDLTYTVTGQNGCSITKIYKVFVGTNPAVSFGTTGNTDICITETLTFNITGTDNNPPATTYTVTFNDGSAPQVFSHPPPGSVTHTFLKYSCGTTSSNGTTTYPNSFFASIVATNPCRQSEIKIVPIYVSTPPVADFTLQTTTSCTNNQVCITNTSTGSVEISNQGSTCSPPKTVWTITPLTGVSLVSGSYGNDFGLSSSNTWLSGTDVICPTFTLPGTYTIKMEVGNRCGTDQTTKTILVNPIPTATISGTTSVCRNTAPPIITFTGANGTAPYTFTYKINEGGNKTVTTTSGNSATVSALTGTAGTFNYNLVSVQDASTAACSQPQTGVATVTVKALPTAAISGTTSVCLNAASPIITFTGANGTAPYTFTYNINGGIVQTLTTISGNSVTVPALTSTAGTFSYNLVSVQEGSSTACSQSQAGVATVTVNPIPTVDQPANTDVCNGMQTVAISFSGSVSNTIYNWVNTNSAIGLAPIGTGTIPTFTALNPGTNPVTATITVTPTANGCTGSPQSFTITVNPLSAITFSPDNQTPICSGENTTLVTLNSATPGVTYNWISVAPPGISGAAPSGTSTIPVQTLVNSTNVPLTVIYKATASLTGGINCEGAEFIYTITVNPKPFIGNLATTACSGSTFTVTPSNGSGNIVTSGTTYTWSDPIISPAVALTGAAAQSSPQSAISQLLTNITNAVATATYSVTPMYSGCAGLPFDVIVTIKPMPMVNAVSDISHCNGEQNAQIDFSGNVPGTVYNWVSNNTSIGIAGSGSGIIPAFRALNTGSAPKIATIKVTPSANGCTGVPESFNVTVYPILPVSVSITAGSNNICPGTSVTFTATPVNGGFSPVYQWIVNGTNVGTNTSTYTYAPIDGDTIKCQLLSNAICPSGNPAMSNTVKMTVYSNLPANVTISASTNDVCPGESVTFAAVPFNEGFAPIYQWFVNGVKAGANQPVFSYNPVNGDVVKCQLTSSNTCSSGGVIMSNLINMIVAPPALQPSFTFVQTNDCAPVNVLLKNTTPSGGVAYIWDFGDGSTDSTATTEDVTHTYQNFTSAPIVFNISLKVITRFTHCFNVLIKQITVNPELFAGTPVNYTGCSPFTQKFENANAGAQSYRWITDKNILLSTDFQPTLTFTASNKRDSTYIVYLIAKSAAGCSDTIVNTIKVSPALEMPSFTYSGNSSCQSVTYTFINTSSEGPDLFVWDFDDGTIITTNHANQTVTHTFFNGMDTPLPFNVKLTNMNGTYCSLSVIQKIMVDPEFTAGFPVTFQGCSPLTRTFINAYGGARSYQWKSTNGTILSTNMAPTLTFTAQMNRDSTHLVYLISASMDGCMDTVINKVIVRSANKTSFTASPMTGCSPLQVQFTNTSSSQTKSYEWDFGDTSDYSVIESPRHIFIDPNGLDRLYNASLVGYNQFGCSDTASIVIHLLATPQVDFIATPVKQTYPYRTVQLSNLTPPGNWTFTWNFGDQKPSITGNPSSYMYDLPGEYVISLSGKGANCENIKRNTITIDPGIPLASFEPDTAGCAPLKVNFRNYSQNGSQYQWDFGNGNQSVDFSPSAIYHDAGTYVVKLNVLNQFGVMSTTERTIVVYPVPKAFFKPMPNLVKIPGQSVTFFNNSENGQDYLWEFGDGSVSPDAEPVHQYIQTGFFNVKLYVTSAEGCKDTLLMLNAVEAYSDGLKVPNAFMPDKGGPSNGNYVPGDPRNHVFYPSVAAGDLDEYELMIYNRWGNLLFDTHEVEKGWDGYYNGRLCPMAVYVWKIRCKFKSGSIVTKVGDVTLIQ